MFALNQGEICTTPSRILVHEDIADLFIERMQARLKLVKAGNPLDPETMIGSQVSKHNAIHIIKEDESKWWQAVCAGYYINQQC
jgi:aldehyde dehydrogenase (NAD+)/aldehyde dehydrogenase